MPDILGEFKAQQQRCARLYRNGDVIVDFRRDVETWLEYNRLYRPGCALFVNDELKEPGIFLSKEEAIQMYRVKAKLDQGGTEG